MLESRKRYISDIGNALTEFDIHVKSRTIDNNTQSEALEIAIQIEELINKILTEGRNYKSENTSSYKDKVFLRYIKSTDLNLEYNGIDDLLDRLIKRFNEILDENIEITEKTFFKKISLGGDGKRGILSPDTNNSGTNKIASAPKLFEILRVLSDLGYEAKDIKKIQETLIPGTGRNIPYVILHLTDEVNPKTILVCDEIGNATFLFDGLLSPETFEGISKEDARLIPTCVSVSYGEDYYGRIREALLGSKKRLESSSVEKQERKEVNWYKRITKEDVKKYISSKSAKYWSNLSWEEINNPDIVGLRGNGAAALATAYGYNLEEKNVRSKEGFIYFVCEVLGKNPIEYLNIITREDVIDYFQNHKSIEEWLVLTEPQIANKEIVGIKGKGIDAIASAYGYDKDINVKVKTNFIYFVCEVLGKNPLDYIKITTKEDVIDYFKSKPIDYWASLSEPKIINKKIIGLNNNGIQELSRIYGYDKEVNMNVRTYTGFVYFVCEVLGENPDKYILAQKDVIDFFSNESIDYWASLSSTEIKNKVVIKRRSIIYIANTIMNFPNEEKDDVRCPTGFIKFVCWALGVNSSKYILSKEDVVNHFKRKSIEEWATYSKEDIANEKLKGKYIGAMAAEYYGGKPPYKVITKEGFIRFVGDVLNIESIDLYISKINKIKRIK